MKKNNRTDRELLTRIQPRGGITAKDEMYMKSGDGYSACLHIMEYPDEAYDHWLNKVCNINGSIATVDISTENIYEVEKNINHSLQEQHSRFKSANKYTEESTAQRKYLQIKEMADEIKGMHDVVKNIDIRLFFADRSLADLEETMKEARKKIELESFRAYQNINETKSDWSSFYQSYQEQQQNPFSVEGQVVTSAQLAGGNPFHFSSLEDPLGTFYGTTTTHGNVFWDLFYKDKTRLSYSAAISGVKGSGKSTILKKIFEDRAIRGDYVRAFDASGEFRPLTEHYAGKIIKPDGSTGEILNMLEILKAGDNENTNFSMHISKVKTIFRHLNPNIPEEMLDMLGIMLRSLYERFHLTPEDENGNVRQITGLASTEYPILSDLEEEAELTIKKISSGTYNEVEMAVAQEEAKTASKIKNMIDSLIKSYGNIFNGYSSVNNIVDEQIVTIDISNLKSMDSNVFDAQLYNLVTLCWNDAVSNGRLMLNKYTNHQIAWEDIVRFVIIVDESHEIINTNKIKLLDQLTTYLREDRKYFCSFIFASQSIRDYVPDGSDSIAIDKLKTLFEQTQYKLIFRQDENALDSIERIFGQALKDNQIKKIPQLQQGQCFMAISSYKSFEFQVYLTPEEEKLYAGGA